MKSKAENNEEQNKRTEDATVETPHAEKPSTKRRQGT